MAGWHIERNDFRHNNHLASNSENEAQDLSFKLISSDQFRRLRSKAVRESDRSPTRTRHQARKVRSTRAIVDGVPNCREVSEFGQEFSRYILMPGVGLPWSLCRRRLRYGFRRQTKTRLCCPLRIAVPWVVSKISRRSLQNPPTHLPRRESTGSILG